MKTHNYLKAIAFCISSLAVLSGCSSVSKSSTEAYMKSYTPEQMKEMYDNIKAKYEKLRPQSIQPAEGYIKYPYLIPAGFYKQLWDWDGFFIGYHLASIGKPEYLKYWALNFVQAIDSSGYVSGCVTTQGPRPLFGKFAMKPFLAQGAYISASAMNDFNWIAPVFEGMKKVCRYREKTQYDEKYGLFFWENAMQSGADNTVVLTNDDNEKSAILAVDINVFQYREYLSMSKIALKLGKENDAKDFTYKAAQLKEHIMKYLWDKEEFSFWNVRRRDGRAIKRVSYSNFIPLIQKDFLSQEEGREMIKRYLWNSEYMLAGYGMRSLAKNDPDYNNENIIVPYSNWQGPTWIVANYLYSIGLKNYGFDSEYNQLTGTLGEMIIKDIDHCGSMHENYNADTGEPLAPTAEQSKDGIFTGFVGWNLLLQNIFMGAVDNNWKLLEIN